GLEQREPDLAQRARDRLLVELAALAEVAEGGAETVGEGVEHRPTSVRAAHLGAAGVALAACRRSAADGDPPRRRAPDRGKRRDQKSFSPRAGDRLFWRDDLRASGWWAISKEGGEITLEPLRPRTFGKDSPVTAYWLRRCDGFQVAGRRGLTTVERAVYYDDDPLHPSALEVNRIRRRGPKLVPVEAVEAVCPMRRVLYRRRRPSAPTRAAVGGVSALAPYGRRAARTTASSASAMWAYGAPRVSASARAGGAAARERW